MKKIFVILFLAFCIGRVYAQQDWKTYLQIGAGTGYLMNGDLNTTPLLMLELGRSYRWADIVASIESEKENRGTSFSVNIKTKFDIVKMIKADLPHSFKLGIGEGIGTTIHYKWWHYIPDNVVEGKQNFLYTQTILYASYEYNPIDKLWVGAFFQNYTSDIFFGKYYVGLSVRTDF